MKLPFSIVVLLAGGVALAAWAEQAAAPARMLFDFRVEEGQGFSENWVAVNDGVMGGRSEGGAVLPGNGRMVFSGVLSLENNGGFSSIRAEKGELDLGGFDGIALRVRGDGRTYDLRLTTGARTENGGEISYQGRFETRRGEWTEVRVTFTSLIPTFRGRTLPGPAFESSEADSVRLLLGDKKSGPFRLEVEWIQAYREAVALATE